MPSFDQTPEDDFCAILKDKLDKATPTSTMKEIQNLAICSCGKVFTGEIFNKDSKLKPCICGKDLVILFSKEGMLDVIIEGLAFNALAEADTYALEEQLQAACVDYSIEAPIQQRLTEVLK